MASLSLSTVSRLALDLLYPPRCALCGRGGDFLCDACAGGLPRAEGARCDVCWSPKRYESAACRTCAEHPTAVSRIRAAFRYEADVRRLVQQYKFRGHSALAPSLARPLRDAYVEHGLDAEVIVPVPLAGRRRRTRGYNQALLLAREVGRGLGLPAVEALRRVRFDGTTQAQSATAEQRRRNVVGAFAVSRPDTVAGRRVLLIDDITTTGATLDACARALHDAGAASVDALTFARED